MTPRRPKVRQGISSPIQYELLSISDHQLQSGSSRRSEKSLPDQDHIDLADQVLQEDSESVRDCDLSLELSSDGKAYPVLTNRILETSTTCFLFSLDYHDEIDVERLLSSQFRSCCSDGEHRSLVIRYSSSVNPTIFSCHLERWIRPLISSGSRNYIVMSVAQYSFPTRCLETIRFERSIRSESCEDDRVLVRSTGKLSTGKIS